MQLIHAEQSQTKTILFLDAVLFPQVTQSTSTSLRVRWEPALANLSHGVILGYYLGYRENRYMKNWS